MTKDDVLETLNEILEYFDNKSDADYDYEKEAFVGNKAMMFCDEIERIKDFIEYSLKPK